MTNRRIAYALGRGQAYIFDMSSTSGYMGATYSQKFCPSHEGRHDIFGVFCLNLACYGVCISFVSISSVSSLVRILHVSVSMPCRGHLGMRKNPLVDFLNVDITKNFDCQIRLSFWLFIRFVASVMLTGNIIVGREATEWYATAWSSVVISASRICYSSSLCLSSRWLIVRTAQHHSNGKVKQCMQWFACVEYYD